MESKKLNKKFSTIFWNILYFLPLIVFFIYLISYFAMFRESANVDAWANTDVLDESFNVVINFFGPSGWWFANDLFSNLFDVLSIPNNDVVAIFIIYSFSWLVMMNFLHILVDVLLLLPRMFHNFMERWS